MSSQAASDIKHFAPGMLLTTTECNEDIDYNWYLKVPNDYKGSKLHYGDLLTVISHIIVADSFECEVATGTYALHHKSQRLLFFKDIEQVGWIHIVT